MIERRWGSSISRIGEMKGMAGTLVILRSLMPKDQTGNGIVKGGEK